MNEDEPRPKERGLFWKGFQPLPNSEVNDPALKDGVSKGMDEEVPVSKDGKVPTWLIVVYATLLIWGLIWFYLNFDGPWKEIDPGAWKKLEKAANTTILR